MNHSFLLEIALVASTITTFFVGVIAFVINSKRQDAEDSYAIANKGCRDVSERARSLQSEVYKLTGERDFLQKELDAANAQLDQINAIINPEEDEDE